MSPRPVSASAGGRHAALASPTRRRLLELLQSDSTARDVHDLGATVGLHPSTARSHLEILRRAGLVVRRTHRHDGRGRPRTVYAAVESQHGRGHYEGLAALLAAGLADTADERAARAEQIGEQWAAQLSGVPTLDGAADEEVAVHVSGLFERLGFAPELRTSEAGRQIALHACPFRPVAREHPEVVCAVHLGLLRGTLARLGATTTPQLTPFVEPELCMVRLGARE
ncbi:metalloregulator ArsR/SmtB family transcription factor [Phycicoccus sp. HDW14]|uniref:helix-turn-helix transcriptional regulator n=1 Tax=Phycicoccus sp. HDW14 TaxID=2714941 RepID=UPI002738B9A2|nr:ArsR family transcriptional regulator [Phycicoccus sp. HDW14]